MPTKIVAFLQNQWFKDPEGVKRMFDEHPERRERYIEAFLFMGCLTGKRLRAAFGEELCDQIVWEETSREIGGHSASRFPPDPEHIAAVIQKHKPDIILTFGEIARKSVKATMQDLCYKIDISKVRLLHGPHPAARVYPMPKLRSLARIVQQMTPK